MLGKYVLILFVVCCSLLAKAQEKTYFLKEETDSLLLHDSTPYRWQKASWQLSFIGEHALAMEYKDKQFPQARTSLPTPAQQESFRPFKPLPAREYILEQAAKSQIIILNESHHMPLHREFLRSLLPQLKALGYTHLGMEALDYKDSLLNQRKYPTLASGFYCREPSMGNLIRTALSLNMDVFAYEQIVTRQDQGLMGREKAEAYNIAEHMKLFPGEKIIIYCGYDHAAEDTLRNFMGLPMAGQLKALTGINPFTIDQTTLTEYYIVGSRYRMLINLPYAAVFKDSVGQMFNLANLPKRMDINLYHPNTNYVNGRPDWKVAEDFTICFPQKEIKISYPCLVRVYLADEPADAVPLDVTELYNPEDKKAVFVLKNKRQKLIVSNLSGQEQIIPLK